MVTAKNGKPYRSTTTFAYLSNDLKPVLLGKDGTVAFDVRNGDTVYIAFAHYRGAIPVGDLDSVEVRVNKSTLYEVARQQNMVNTGLSMVRRDHLTVPISSLEVAELRELQIYSNLADLMRGRFAGVTVTSDNRIIIRGMTSINGDNEPLFVVDGVNMNWASAQMINVQDIKTIDVLKDGSGYGVRGANGVVVITTKSGR